MKTLTLLVITALSFTSYANSNDVCANELKRHIEKQYDEAGREITNLIGPVVWNQSLTDSQENMGLTSMVGYAFSYNVQHDVTEKGGDVFISAECAHAELAYLMDQNGDGVFNLRDANIKGDNGL